MATFEKAVMHCNEISSLLDAYRSKLQQALNTAHTREHSENNTYYASRSGYSTEHNDLTNENNRKKNLRYSKTHEYLDATRRLLDSINDPHWFRMRQHYYDATIGHASPDRYLSTTPEELISLLENIFSQLHEEVLQLCNAFMPPAVSNAVGFVVPSFRKAKYTRIASLRNKLLGIAVALCDCSDLCSRQTQLDEALATAQGNLEENHALNIQQIRESTNESLAYYAEYYSNQLHTSVSCNTLQTQMPLQIGQYTYPSTPESIIREQSDASDESSQPLFTIPVTCSGFEKSIVFRTSGQSCLAEFYSQLALDILSNDPSTNIAMIDIAGLGRNYYALAELSGVSHFSVMSTADQVQSYLETAERSISEVYAGRELAGKTYIFVDDCVCNIPDRCVESLARIIANGSACGVYVIASVKETVSADRRWNSILGGIDASKFNVSSNRLLIGSGFITLASSANSASRVSLIATRLEHVSKSADVIPLWKTFPDATRWQTHSSANGISVPIGIDVQTGSPSYFSLTEEKPYALIVGDVDVGKSSALHCLTLQMMANYAPSEVRIAIGDFKDGCEFNTYVRSGVLSVDAVVNSQDPDTMSSFLGFYVAEMHRRQVLFNTTAEQCGRIIRKYETYREACSDHGLPHVPRICLIIDEFQSLFDSPVAGTSALLSELVRKGRTFGIHIIMASQRAVSDNPRNGFSSELKNYFTTRMVFRCPQQAARSMLSERCADTGRENSGIPGAALLKKGHCIVNTYMGQNERDNSTIQCFYASDSAIEKVIRVLKHLNGVSKHGVLLAQEAPSVTAPGKVDRYILLGDSVRLKHDYSNPNEDVFRDNSLVGVDINKLRSNIVVASTDVRVHFSSFKAILDATPTNAKINLCGSRDNPLTELFLQESGESITHIERIAELTCEPCEEYIINLIIEPERVSEYSQATSLRRTTTIEHFDRILDLPEGGNVMNVIFTSSFKMFKTNLPYVAAKVPLRIVGTGDNENLRLAIGENTVLARSNFDTPSQTAIKAYYHNKTSGKTGKVILFRRTL